MNDPGVVAPGRGAVAAGARVPAELSGSGGTLGVVLIHDIYGRGPYMRSVADALGSSGIATATVDLFGGKVPSGREEGMALGSSLTEEGVLASLEDARLSLSRRLASTARIGTLGFCMGGGYALLGGCRLPFDFVVDFYGRISRVDDVTGLRGPVLLILGSEDERITPWALGEFLPAANRAKRRVSVELFPGVRHAFHRPGWEGHDPAAAAEAWRRTLSFLAELRGATEPLAAHR